MVANELGFEQILPSQARTGAKRMAIVERLSSPKEETPPDFNLLAPAPREISRSVTPDLVPDSMASRIPPADIQSPKESRSDSPLQLLEPTVTPAVG